MKIELSGAYRAYSKNSAAVQQQSGKATGKNNRLPTGQQDSISISSEAAQKSELDRLVHNTAAEAETGRSAQSLAELRQSVQSGVYRVPTEKLAEAVLSAYV